MGPKEERSHVQDVVRPHTPRTRPEFVYSHQWQVGDLVIWDNRCTMHRGRPHDDAHPRDLRRATTLEAGSTLDEVAEPNLKGWPAFKAADEPTPN